MQKGIMAREFQNSFKPEPFPLGKSIDQIQIAEL